MLRTLIDFLLLPYGRLGLYVDTARYLEAVHHPNHGELMTPALDRGLLALEVGLTFLGAIAGAVCAILLGIDATPHSVPIIIFDVFGIPYGVTVLNVSVAGFFTSVCAAGGYLLSRLLRAYIIHRVFSTRWADRSFMMPVAPAFF